MSSSSASQPSSAGWPPGIASEAIAQELRSVHLSSLDAEKFRIAFRSGPRVDLITVAGDIDLASAPELHELVRQLVAEGRHHVNVDLKAVTFVGTAALTFLLEAQRDLEAAGGSLTILGHNPLLTRLLAAACLTGVLNN